MKYLPQVCGTYINILLHYIIISFSMCFMHRNNSEVFIIYPCNPSTSNGTEATQSNRNLMSTLFSEMS
jgi:hypothetical protein